MTISVLVSQEIRSVRSSGDLMSLWNVGLGCMVPKTGFGNRHDWITAAIGLYAVDQCVGWGKGGGDRSVFLSSW